jgi:hypothetical protein
LTASARSKSCRRKPIWSSIHFRILFRPDCRIAARAAGWRNDRHIARLRRWCANFRVNSYWRAEHAVGSRQLVAERLGSRIGSCCGALRRDSALLRHRLCRSATRRIPRGRWRGRLSRWRRWRTRSLSGCRAGCRQSCHDQKKRFSLHGEQMLPRFRCSRLAEKPTGVFALPAVMMRSRRAPHSDRPEITHRRGLRAAPKGLLGRFKG